MEENYLNLLTDIENIEFETLREAMNKYPWFSALRIVWLLKHKKEKPELFPYELKKHVIYLHDRKQFYQILNHDIWQKIIHSGLEDDIEDQIRASIEYSEEFRKEILEFSYEPEQEQNPEDETGNYSKEDNSAENNPEKNPEPRKADTFSAWVEEEESKGNPNNNLIDRFLEIDPGPIRPDKQTNLKGDVSTPSVQESESFITDTLARIYIKQGLYSKAIFAYEKLSLKYPEKSIYFATQIEEIKKLINNK